MAEFSIVRRTFGNIFKIAGHFQPADQSRFDDHITKLQNVQTPIYLDFSQLTDVEPASVESLIQKIKDLSHSHASVTLIKAPAYIRQAIQSSASNKPLPALDHIDEALFPSISGYRPKLEKPLSELENICPSCSMAIRPGASRCFHCNFNLVPRRSERNTAAVPFLYSVAQGGDFLQSAWKGGVTEDIDMKMFSGIGFFTPARLQEGVSLHIIFPTLQWNADMADPSKLLIFSGRG